MYKVYFSNRSVSIVPTSAKETPAVDTVYYRLAEGDDLSQLPFWFEKAEEIQDLVIEAGDIDAAFSQFVSRLKVEVAAGGLIRNGRGQALLFWRRGAWDMPKGHQESGETLEQCALREVREETGLTRLELGGPICVTYHTYHNNGNFVLKESHWYKMSLIVDEAVRVQTEEDIEKALWCGPLRLKRLLKDAYPSVRDVFAAENK